VVRWGDCGLAGCFAGLIGGRRLCLPCLGRVVLVSGLPGAGSLRVAQGGPAARLGRVVRRRRRRVLGGSPAAARRVLSSWRAFHAARIRWLRSASRHVVMSSSGVRPIRRHQPREMSLLAGSLMVAKPL
jgi:hypothetical protein